MLPVVDNRNSEGRSWRIVPRPRPTSRNPHNFVPRFISFCYFILGLDFCLKYVFSTFLYSLWFLGPVALCPFVIFSFSRSRFSTFVQLCRINLEKGGIPFHILQNMRWGKTTDLTALLSALRCWLKRNFLKSWKCSEYLGNSSETKLDYLPCCQIIVKAIYSGFWRASEFTDNRL